MDYEFRRNSLDGTVWALFSMDHEVLGRWLTDELGKNQTLRLEIMNNIERLQCQQIHDYQWVGRDLTLQLDEEEARVFANVLGFGDDLDAIEEQCFSIYDSESTANCGLEDFAQVLQAWADFIDQR